MSRRKGPTPKGGPRYVFSRPGKDGKMTRHYQFGEIADVDGAGLLDVGSCLLHHEVAVLALPILIQTDGEDHAGIALQLDGRLNKSDDSVSTTTVMQVMDAGHIAGMLAGQIQGLGERAVLDFKIGFDAGLRGCGLGDDYTPPSSDGP